MDAARMIEERVGGDIAELASMVDPDQEGWSRVALTEVDVEGRQWALKQFRRLGLDARIDPAGNVIGCLQGAIGGRSIMVGSHVDTVPGGGRFDGIVGVVGAIELVRQLQESSTRLDHDLYIVVFFSEEPNRFGLSCIGSRALTGALTFEHLQADDGDGMSFGNALAGARIDASKILTSAWDWSTVDAFLELHIEQGPLLEELGAEIGLVEKITGLSRFRTLFTGQADHAGTAAMDRRHDAGCAAAGTVLAVERIASAGKNARGTVGGVHFTPEAVNVVNARAEIRGEFRSPDGDWLKEAEEALTGAAAREAAARGVTVELDWLPTQEPQPMGSEVVEVVGRAVDELGLSRVAMFSGAEHDAALIARRAPTAMLFIPSVGGRSHCPEEFTELPDIVRGVRALVRSVMMIDNTVVTANR